MPVAPVRHSLAPLKFHRLAACLAVVFVVVFHARVGAASKPYPGEIRNTLQLDCTPTCLLCHKTMEGGLGTLNDYGEKSKALRLIQLGPAAFYGPDGPAATNNADMDAEGKTDRNEIIANTDPGSTEDNPICSDAIYGCGAAQMAPGGAPRTYAWAFVAAFGVAGLLLRQLRA